MLVEIEGERVRVFAGLAMRWRLVQVLGPVRALRVAQAVARMGGPVLGVDWGRRRFLGRALGALAGLLLMRHAGQAAAAPPPPTSGGLPIRRSRRLEGTERAQALQHLQNHPDLKAMGLTVPPDDGEFPLVIAHELADGNTLTTDGWPIEGQEIVVALLFARIARVSLGHEGEDRRSDCASSNAKREWKVGYQAISQPDDRPAELPRLLSVMGASSMRVYFVEHKLSYKLWTQHCCL